MPILRLLLLFTACTVLSGCGPKSPGLIPVKGSVLINGQPAARVAVSLHHVDKSLTGNSAHPCAATDDKGQFLLSTNKDGDGVMPGEFYVYFIWWSDPDPEKAKDLLAGAYSESQLSTFKIKIDANTTELPAFQLKADPAQAKKFVK
ncbi:MAG: hypothetical protein QM703_16350 [Gemmatales bacterium]